MNLLMCVVFLCLCILNHFHKEDTQEFHFLYLKYQGLPGPSAAVLLVSQP